MIIGEKWYSDEIGEYQMVRETVSFSYNIVDIAKRSLIKTRLYGLFENRTIIRRIIRKIQVANETTLFVKYWCLHEIFRKSNPTTIIGKKWYSDKIGEYQMVRETLSFSYNIVDIAKGNLIKTRLYGLFENRTVVKY